MRSTSRNPEPDDDPNPYARCFVELRPRRVEGEQATWSIFAEDGSPIDGGYTSREAALRVRNMWLRKGRQIMKGT